MRQIISGSVCIIDNAQIGIYLGLVRNCLSICVNN